MTDPIRITPTRVQPARSVRQAAQRIPDLSQFGDAGIEVGGASPYQIRDVIAGRLAAVSKPEDFAYLTETETDGLRGPNEGQPA